MEAQILVYVRQLLPHSEAILDLSRSFMQLGGHSLTALRLSYLCKRNGIQLTIAHILKSESLSELIRSACDLSLPLVKSSLQDAETKAPMTEMQLSFIHGSQARTGTNIILFRQLCHLDQVENFRSAWKSVIASEPIFRTSFMLDGDDGFLMEEENENFSWEVVNCTEEEISTVSGDWPSFEPVGHMFRLLLYPQPTVDPENRRAMILWYIHHALLDGFSMETLLSKLNLALAGQVVPPGLSFVRFAKSLHSFQVKNWETGKAYWSIQAAKLEKSTSQLRLSSILQQSTSGLLLEVSKSETMTRSTPINTYTHFAKQHGITTASFYFSAWALVLSHYSDSDLVSFGVVMSGRNLPIEGAIDTVGPLVNTLPFCVPLSKSSTVLNFLTSNFSSLVELSGYQWTVPSQGYKRNFGTAIAMQFDHNASDVAATRQADCSHQTVLQSEIPLTVMIAADGTLHFQYFNKRNASSSIGQVADMFCRALDVLMKPHYTVDMCLDDIFSSSMRQSLLQMGNCHSGLTTKSSIHEDLVTLFQNATSANARTVACEKQDKQITYLELHDQASRIARRLSTMIKPGDIVCVHADQSLLWIAAIYGILMADGVYCPLNANMTPQFRSSIFSSSSSKIFLVSHSPDKIYRPHNCDCCLSIEEILSGHCADASAPLTPRLQAKPASNAYLCFTSGSTGQPKGVLCTHGGLVAFQRDLEVRLFAQPGHKVAQLMSVSFDGSIHEIFSALSYGATLVLPERDDPFAHLQQAQSVIFTPSIASVLDPVDFPTLSYVYLVGEAVSEHVNDLWTASKTCFNMYGPTEATCGATIKKLSFKEPVTIGKPNSSTRIYILNQQNRLLPHGVIGRIFLAGVQVSNGYIGRPDATQEKFLPDSIMRGLYEKMYDTGDLGYWTSDGEIVCLGRNDRQIKLRGFRLELDDIEKRIETIKGVDAAAVAVKDDHLIAMIQPIHLDVQWVLKEMASIMPAHAIPHVIKAVECFPMTAAGKMDYTRLTQDQKSDDPSNGITTETEKCIEAVWRQLLPISTDVIINSDSVFTEMGGDSIRQLKLATRLSALFSCDISLRTIIQATTLRDLSNEVNKCRDHLCSPTAFVAKRDPGWLSPIEREWMKKYQYGGHTSAFNVSFACRLDNTVSVDRLKHSWDQVLSVNPLLGCRYRYHSRDDSRYTRATSSAAVTSEIVPKLDIFDEVNKPFLLDQESPIRVLISPEYLVVVVSHIVCDLTTLQLLLTDVAKVYNSSCSPSSPISYVDSSTWKQVPSQPALDYWKDHLQHHRDHGAQSLGWLPVVERKSFRGKTSTTKLSSVVNDQMRNLVESSSYTLHQICLAAVALALQPRDKTIDMILGGPHMNRHTESDLQTVGLFLEPLPILIKFMPTLTEDPDSTTFLQAVQSSSQRSLAHAIPWNELLRLGDIKTNFPNHPLFDVMVTFHGGCNLAKSNIAGVEPVFTFAQGAKFKLMCEFTQSRADLIILRLEYDDEIITDTDVIKLEMMISKALDLLTQQTHSYLSIKKELQTLLDDPRVTESRSEDMFAKLTSEI